MASLIIYLASWLCLVFLSILIGFFSKLWWIPRRIQAVMASRGIRGPLYKFFHGCTKEIINMKKEIMISPMGLSHDIFPRIQPHIYSWLKLYGMKFIYWYGTQAHLVITEPELIKEILNNKAGTYRKPEARGFVKKLLGDGLVTSEGEKWSKLRKLANHAFHAERLKGMIPAMTSSVETMLERWRQYDGKEIDVFQEFKILTSEVISRTAFGSSYLEGEEILNMLTKMAVIISRYRYKIGVPIIGKFVKTCDDVELDRLEQGIRNSIVSMIKKREKMVMMAGSNKYGSDFLGLLVTAYHDGDETKKITMDDLIDECKTFYFAGHETTTSLLTWTVLLLAIHSNWKEKVRNEVLELFGQQNPTPDSLRKLKTMSMVINESLRLYSPVLHIERKIKREARLGKLILPSNVQIFIPILALHHNTQIWGEDAHLFKPERFEGGVAKAGNNNPAAFLPFGSGPRICVGLSFATTEAKIALSMILQRYKFNLSPTYVHSPMQLLTTCPQRGLQVMFQSL